MRFESLHSECEWVIVRRLVLHGKVVVFVVHNLRFVHLNGFVQIPKEFVQANFGREFCVLGVSKQ